jgi:hypothetical protein
MSIRFPRGRGPLWLLIGAVVAVSALAGWQALRFRHEPLVGTRVVLKAAPDGVTVDLGRLWSASDPIETTVPLKKVGLRSSEIAGTDSTCGCLVVAVEKDKEAVRIRFDPRGRAGESLEMVRLMPRESSMAPKVIRIRADVIPGWYAQPLSVRIDEVRPNERRSFRCDARIEHDLPKIVINRCEAQPACSWLTLKPVIGADARSIIIEGEVIGTVERGSYEGKLELVIGPEPLQRVMIPLSVKHTGSVWSDPEAVTLWRGRSDEGVLVRCISSTGEPLRVDRVETPSFLVARPTTEQGHCALRITQAEDSQRTSQPSLKQADVRVFFVGIDTPLSIHVLCLN